MRPFSSSRPSAARQAFLAGHAARMRQAPTGSEALLFDALRGGRLGVSFRRQVPLLGRYIADLLAPSIKLVIEIDGGYHAGRGRADARRDRALARAGYTVLHVEAEHVVRDLPTVVAHIQEAVDTLSP